jgi:hypothetical protein
MRSNERICTLGKPELINREDPQILIMHLSSIFAISY